MLSARPTVLTDADWQPGTIGRSVGIFGGTFDPVHVGHLVLAERAREELALDLVVFMPANVPPHKPGHALVASGSNRSRMLELAIAGNPGFAVSVHELEREGVSYTVDTLEHLRRLAPEVDLTLLIGGDNAREFHTWREPRRVSQLANIAVWRRPGSRLPEELLPGVPLRAIDAPLLEISSTEIRARIASEQSIRYLVTDGVADFITSHGLYR